MKNKLLSLFRGLLSPSLRYELRELYIWLGELLRKICFWNWAIARFPTSVNELHEIVYIGRKSQQDLVRALLNVDRNATSNPVNKYGAERRVVISELPFPGALKVPSYLGSRVSLGRPLEEIMVNFHSQLRRELKKTRPRYQLRQVTADAEIERVDRDMLKPYAIARHGIGAAQIALSEVKREAQQFGRLDLLLLDGEEVGCQLGHVTIRAGKSHWSANRFGYPEAIFSDPKRLRDTNSMNNHFAMECAIEKAYDYYDIGGALGKPGDGLLEWKRRRGGELYLMGKGGCFYVKLPKADTAWFLWDAPLFAVENHQLSLHLGLPHSVTVDEVAARYREMGFAGLFKVYLHCAIPPAEELLETLRSYYAAQKSPPAIEVVASV